MVDPQRGNPAGGLAIQHIGRVEPAAQANLDHAGIGRYPQEREESRGGGYFEEAGRKILAQIEHFLQKIGQHRVRNQAPGNADAFVVTNKVRLGRGVDGVAFGLQHRAQVGAGAALAIGSGDMEHRRQGLVRIAEARQQFMDHFQPQPPARQAERPQPVKLRLDARIVGDREVFHHSSPSGERDHRRWWRGTRR